MMFRFAFLFCVICLLEHGAHAATCSPGWIAVGQRCYYFSRDTVNFYQALSFCAQYGAALVEMLDYKETNFVNEQFKRREIEMFWIGITDMFMEGKWFGATSLRRRVGKWNKGEPNNYGHAEHCVEVKRWRWNDIKCTHLRYFACSKE